MYIAKSSGRNLYQLYNGDIQQQHIEQAQIQRALTDAIQLDQLFLMYQPQINLATGKIVGTEAFIRWQHPTLGLIKPSRFLPIAEESNLTYRIGEWVIHAACRQCAEFRRLGVDELSVSVNLSGKQLHAPLLLETIARALAESALPPEALILEISESMIMANIEKSKKVLSALHTLGVKISIDNFGTGFSNFQQLLRLPISALKIDRRLVALLGESDERQSQVITQALIQLALGLGISVVAEGVETDRQLAILREKNCDVLQGWIHSPAMPVDEAIELIREYVPEAWLQGLQRG
jgi:EAL domain-containing protein (putative c-di-GMP-specific phosphodiesterase class I)